MSLSGVIKFLLGFALALAILFLMGVGAARYVIARVSSEKPPRPTFPNDLPSPKPSAAASPAASPSAAASPAAPSPSPAVGGYPARVTESIGLIVRQDPSLDAEQLDGVAYEQEIIVLEESADGSWQKVRLRNGIEGWVRGGNTERIN